MLHFIWVLIVGAVIGSLASALVNRDLPMGWLGNIFGGLVGAWLGERFLGSWGPIIGGMAIVPALVGAIVVVLLTSWLFNKTQHP
ncbi:GlsB/YeaQ/YmgE family stress response membrane protein [Lapidilactobacillus luobeiensis]|uniref:GlsB/YeaQ/YmgE family stress response membrane protein n=1 Tax=Lapidilactobacillus luobeiensis TaxID=2950371 RepID=UPI0021C3B437|nr:GlsB/YeaQ/YmgE family stress response membrane protein [Lapidilactobacillus luobeiensis]